jgi:hypothetical protein
MTTLALVLHPGHGLTEPSSLRHYLTEPIHVIAIASAVAVIAVVASYAWRAYQRQR